MKILVGPFGKKKKERKIVGHSETLGSSVKVSASYSQISSGSLFLLKHVFQSFGEGTSRGREKNKGKKRNLLTDISTSISVFLFFLSRYLKRLL